MTAAEDWAEAEGKRIQDAHFGGQSWSRIHVTIAAALRAERKATIERCAALVDRYDTYVPAQRIATAIRALEG